MNNFSEVRTINLGYYLPSKRSFLTISFSALVRLTRQTHDFYRFLWSITHTKSLSELDTTFLTTRYSKCLPLMLKECNMLHPIRDVGSGDWMLKCALGTLAALENACCKESGIEWRDEIGRRGMTDVRKQDGRGTRC